MSETDTWYVVKEETGTCGVVPAHQLIHSSTQPATSLVERWGPYQSRDEAIARRVGLIRAGKCKPI